MSRRRSHLGTPFLIAAPDKCARRGDRAVGLLDDFDAPAQTVISELATICCASVVDGRQPIGSVPFKRAGQPIVDETTVVIVTQVSGHSAALAYDLIDAVWGR